MTDQRVVGVEVWTGRVEVWTSATLTDGKPYDSAAGESCWDERLRALLGRLQEQLVDSEIAERFIVVANRVILYTDRPWSGVDIPLTRAVVEFLGWGTYRCERVVDRGELTEV